MFKDLELGPKQREVIAFAFTLTAAIIDVVILGVIFKGLALFVGKFQNVLLPPIVALILVLLTRPYYRKLRNLTGDKQPLALLLYFLSVLIPIGLFLWFASAFAADELLKFSRDLPEMIQSIGEFARSHWPAFSDILDKYGKDSSLTTLLENPAQIAANAVQKWGQGIMQTLMGVFKSAMALLTWAVLPVYVTFFLLAKPFHAKWVGQFLPFLKKDTRKDVIYLLDQFISILITFFRGQVIIALAQGVLYAIGFALVGLPYGIVIGILLGLLNIVPYLGSIVGLGIALPLAFFGQGGSLVRILLVLGVFTVVQTIEGYFLTPKIMGDRTGLHPALIIFAVFFWGTALNGILGMILAVPLTAFAVVFWRLLKKKYITEMV